MLFDIPAAVSLDFFFVPPIFVDMAVGLLLALAGRPHPEPHRAQPLLLASAARVSRARRADELSGRHSGDSALSP
jgi:hypothetical protein